MSLAGVEEAKEGVQKKPQRVGGREQQHSKKGGQFLKGSRRLISALKGGKKRKTTVLDHYEKKNGAT